MIIITMNDIRKVLVNAWSESAFRRVVFVNILSMFQVTHNTHTPNGYSSHMNIHWHIEYEN